MIKLSWQHFHPIPEVFYPTNMTDRTLTEIFSVPGSFSNLPSGHLARGISMPTTELSKQTVPSSYKLL